LQLAGGNGHVPSPHDTQQTAAVPCGPLIVDEAALCVPEATSNATIQQHRDTGGIALCALLTSPANHAFQIQEVDRAAPLVYALRPPSHGRRIPNQKPWYTPVRAGGLNAGVHGGLSNHAELHSELFRELGVSRETLIPFFRRRSTRNSRPI
jgi:hypothetical protein